MSETTLIEEPGSGYRFSWGLALAGGVVAMAVTLLLLMIGSGIGLLLVHPLTNDNPSVPTFLTGGAIYFLVAQAFGFAVGGHVAGRLLGPMPETTFQEEVRAALHGLTSWATAVLGTIVLAAIAGATLSAMYGAVAPAHETPAATASSYEVDKLFRPSTTQPGAAPTPYSATPGGASPPDSTPDQQAGEQTGAAPDYAFARAAHGEATRIVEAGLLQGRGVTPQDRDRLATLISQAARVPQREAVLRIEAADAEARFHVRQTAEIARKTASYASLWIGLSLLFGAVVAMVAAAMARIEDDRESPWSLFAFHRGWR